MRMLSGSDGQEGLFFNQGPSASMSILFESLQKQVLVCSEFTTLVRLLLLSVVKL